MPAKLLRCVADVKARHQKNVNPWAVCVASTGLHPHRKKHAIIKSAIRKVQYD